MATTIVIKNSSTAGSVPTAGQLVQGELAVNVTDRKIFTETAAGTVVEIGGGARGNGADDVFFENSNTINGSYTITTNKNAMSTGPITLANGVTVTVPSASRWVIL
jgi:hypothetical protein